MAKLVLGCGYLGLRVARAWRAAGHDVYATTRRPERGETLRELGIRPVLVDLTESIRLPEMGPLDAVLFAVGYDRASDRTIHEVYVGGLHNALRALPDSLRRFLYISSTGVYGQSAGQQVDEDSVCRPTRQGGRACLAAEALLAGSRFGDRAIVLRLAGLYGPGRLPRLDDLRRGRPLRVAADGVLNLIHVDDAARAVLAAEAQARPPCCYVVADGQPVTRRVFYEEAARLLGLPPPRFEPPLPGTSAAERGGGSKRIRPARLLRDLGLRWDWPSYREGLRQAVADADPGPLDEQT